jgi:hypothetical protein
MRGFGTGHILPVGMVSLHYENSASSLITAAPIWPNQGYSGGQILQQYIKDVSRVVQFAKRRRSGHASIGTICVRIVHGHNILSGETGKNQIRLYSP